jgi:hypothetical protein
MEVGAALCNRAAMGDLTDLQEELAAVDEEFAVAMAQASDPWREKIAEWPEACEFATSPWWRAIESRSRELRSAKAV